MTIPMVDHVELELELRRLPGVSFVGIDQSEGELVVQVLAVGASTEMVAELRQRCERIVQAHVAGDVTVVIDNGVIEPRLARDRVQLLAVLETPGGDEIEVHLAFGEERTVGRGKAAAGPAEAASATIEALSGLRLEVPYTVSAVSGLAAEEGEGVVVVLSSPVGKRYGVATGATQYEAAARATLHALNRTLRRPGTRPAAPAPAAASA